MEDTKLKDILNYEFLSDLSISDDGKKLFYKKTRPNYKENKYDTNIFIYDLKTSENYKATDDDKATIFTFNEDSNLIYKKSSTDEEDVFFVKEGSGVGRKSFSIKKDVQSIKFLKDNLYLIKASEKKTKEEKDRKKENSYFKEIDKLPFYLNGSGFIGEEKSSYYIYNIANGELRLITESTEENKLYFCDINKNLDKILFLKENSTSNKVMDLREDLILYDLKTNSEKTLIANEFSFLRLNLSKMK